MKTKSTKLNTDAAAYLTETAGLSFSKAGVYMMVRSHLALAPSHSMSREGLLAALRVRSPYAVEIVNAVLEECFQTSEDGSIYSARLNAVMQDQG
jgi:hypothetical protein